MVRTLLAFVAAVALCAQLQAGVVTVNDVAYMQAIVPHTAASDPDCNGDGTLNVADFTCYLTRFVAGDLYADANCDGRGSVADFAAFLRSYAVGPVEPVTMLAGRVMYRTTIPAAGNSYDYQAVYDSPDRYDPPALYTIESNGPPIPPGGPPGVLPGTVSFRCSVPCFIVYPGANGLVLEMRR